MEAPPRLELGIKALQASALPLGYGAEPIKGGCVSTSASYHQYMRQKALLTQKNHRKRKAKDAYIMRLFTSGAEDGIRTRDVHLGKVTLYH